MSNVIVGEIYRQIMEKILAAAQNDFEEGGYAPETLHDLKALWQENLSKLHVAQMPWDPKPAPPAIKHENDDTSMHNGNGIDKPEIKYENGGSSQPDIKAEPASNASQSSIQGYAGGGVNSMAEQRAASMMFQKFGDQANASIQAAGLSQPAKAPAATTTSSATTQAPQADAKPSVAAAQNDGAGDANEEWQDVVDTTRDFEPQRPAADRFLRLQMDASDTVANAGLMLNTRENRQALRKLARQQMRIAARASARAIDRGTTAPPQMDGDDDDDDEDDEAINSELDDSQDEMEEQEEDDDGPLGEMILCTWDKVNRVKNKWKCTLKDGVLATHGKEYLFLKATGEFEW